MAGQCGAGRDRLLTVAVAAMAMSASAMPAPAPIAAEVQSKPWAGVISTTVGASGVRAAACWRDRCRRVACIRREPVRCAHAAGDGVAALLRLRGGRVARRRGIAGRRRALTAPRARRRRGRRRARGSRCAWETCPLLVSATAGCGRVGWERRCRRSARGHWRPIAWSSSGPAGGRARGSVALRSEWTTGFSGRWRWPMATARSLLGGDRQRAVLGHLLLHRNEVVASERLIDELWGERPPPTAGEDPAELRLSAAPRAGCERRRRAAGDPRAGLSAAGRAGGARPRALRALPGVRTRGAGGGRPRARRRRVPCRAGHVARTAVARAGRDGRGARGDRPHPGAPGDRVGGPRRGRSGAAGAMPS